ncbi:MULTISPECIES: hypothetical protein [Paraburkholderia]|uniref:Uncharacterized protein n=1 Tax=Paraburkholderia podalyriae TaxID=1938811 RepID=A0ABR7PYC1_9BURK|nr:hypothetical protein [Paraburkholderia podalyriae]MBC8751291.1 hypothetical protein [Paraburkholderia podalyriae]
MTKDFTQEFKDSQAKAWAENILAVLKAPDPIHAVREEVTALIFDCARFQVLVLDAAPNPDPTGLRGWLGISGELRHHLDLLSTTDTYLADCVRSNSGVANPAAVWEAVLLRYRVLWAGMNIFNALRDPLGDVHKEIGSDWFWPLLCIQCAVSEAVYRDGAGLPLTMNPDPQVTLKISSTLLSLVELVRGGSEYPDLEWQQINKVSLPRHA